MNRPSQHRLSQWGWGLLVPLLLWLGLRQFMAVGLPESWLSGLSALRWVWLLTCLGLILADLIWKRDHPYAAA